MKLTDEQLKAFRDSVMLIIKADDWNDKIKAHKELYNQLRGSLSPDDWLRFQDIIELANE